MAEPIIAEVLMGERRVGVVADVDGRRAFEYDDGWLDSGFSIAPVHLPLQAGPFEFPELLRSTTFQGLPGGISDALPDRFGNAVIEAYYLQQGLSVASISPVEKLLYMGDRAMGALRFRPAMEMPAVARDRPLELRQLVDQARQVISGDVQTELREIMAVASSAGGMRAKALVWLNPKSREIHAFGQAAPKGLEPWLVKFDTDGEGKATQYGRIEYAYFLMAQAAGIQMADSNLIEERDRAHFATRRFDITPDRKRLHRISLCGLMHADYNILGAGWSYDLLFRALNQLAAPAHRREEAFRRVAFNLMATNCDDHTKNIEFVCDSETGDWDLAPAFDLTYAHGAEWTAVHQMTVNDKADDFAQADLLALASRFQVKDAAREIERVGAAVARFTEFASQAGLPASVAAKIARDHRKNLWARGS